MLEPKHKIHIQSTNTKIIDTNNIIYSYKNVIAKSNITSLGEDNSIVQDTIVLLRKKGLISDYEYYKYIYNSIIDENTAQLFVKLVDNYKFLDVKLKQTHINDGTIIIREDNHYLIKKTNGYTHIILTYLEKNNKIILHPLASNTYIDYITGQKEITSNDINCIVEDIDFKYTSNTTFNPLVNTDIYFTTLGLYNREGILVSISKFSQAIKKLKSNMNFVININYNNE